jgi:phosphoribosyl 1,2-cyclic phosphate 1,2-diphosphodiesterase
MFADLHCHTQLSDGSVTVQDLIDMACKRGLKAIAVTDHDTVAGVSQAVSYGKEKDILVIPGVEISTLDHQRGRKAHILCYLFDRPEVLEVLLKTTVENRTRAGEEMMKKIVDSYPITEKMVLKWAKGSTSLYKQHMMHALMDAGCTNSIYGDLFRELFDSKKGKVYAKVEYPEVREIIQTIHEAGGLAVLAHPAEYDSYDLLEELAGMGLDGVEVSHPRNRPGDQERLSEFARTHGLVMTGGTDFHGMYSSKFHPVGTFTTAQEQVEALFYKKQKRS